MLNAQGVLTDSGRAWNRSTVHQVLTNEKYISNNVYHHPSFKLKLKHIVNPQENGLAGDGKFEAIVATQPFSHGPRHHSGSESKTFRMMKCWRNCAACSTSMVASAAS